LEEFEELDVELLLLEQAELEAEVGNLEGGGPLGGAPAPPPPEEGEGIWTPQCWVSFMWVVRLASVEKLCLHHTHLNTSLAASAPLFSQ